MLSRSHSKSFCVSKFDLISSHQDDQPTKEDYAVAKFLRFKVPARQAKLHNMEVHCFFGRTDRKIDTNNN